MTSEPPSHKNELTAAQIFALADLVRYQDGAIVSRTLISRATATVTLFAFDYGQGLSEHTSPFDALAHVIEGEAEIVISGKALSAKAGEVLLLPANQPHALKAVSRFKLLLMMVRSG
jgi:quercetin dioxygenase-like cupin family protein